MTKKLYKTLQTVPLLLLSIALLSNCSPARIISDNFDKDIKTSKVEVYREDKILFLAVPAIFGYDNKDKVKLWRKDKFQINVPIGNHKFFVRSNQADRPLNLNIEIKEGETLCFIINPEPKPMVKFIIFPVYWISHAFNIKKIEGKCQETYVTNTK